MLSEDGDLNGDIKVKQQYKYGKESQPPEVLVEFIDDTENPQGTTFEGEKVSTVLLQIIVMTNSMFIGSKKYNAQKSCMILSNKIAEYFDKSVIKENIPQILNARRTQKSPPFPYELGTVAYYGILRFELTVSK
jgi:hypothetical protein